MASKVCGTITSVVKGHIHANVQILWKSIPLSVVITKASCEDMHLSVGDTISVLIKGTDVMLAKSFSGMISARNRVSGIVKRIIQGDVVSKVFVESQQEMLHAIITNTSLKEMDIKESDEVTAIVKSTELILYKETRVMKKITGYGLLIAFILIFVFSLSVLAGDNILIAAASNLRFAMHDICAAFQEENSSIQTKVSYGSSGNFFAQIKQGAPFDIFFSADATYPLLLEKEGMTAKDTQKVFAVGKIVLWFPKESKVDPDKGLQTVASSEVKKLAIANPRHAPYGRAAEESLRYYGLWEEVKGKLIYGENISQTAQFIHTGAADAGIIALSLAISPKMLHEGRYWVIPDESHGDIKQVYVVLKTGREKESVRKFLDFIHGEKGDKILSRYGFVIPDTGENRS